MCAAQTEVCFAPAGLRGPKRRSVLLQRVCAAQNRGLFCSTRCARPKTEVCFAPADVRGLNQALDCFSRCARPQSSARFASADVRGLNQALDLLQPMCAISIKHSIGAAEAGCEVWPGRRQSPPRLLVGWQVYGVSHTPTQRSESEARDPQVGGAHVGLFRAEGASFAPPREVNYPTWGRRR